MGTAQHRDRRDMDGGNRKKGYNGKKGKGSSSKDPAWKTGAEWLGERKQDENSGIKS